MRQRCCDRSHFVRRSGARLRHRRRRRAIWIRNGRGAPRGRRRFACPPPLAASRDRRRCTRPRAVRRNRPTLRRAYAGSPDTPRSRQSNSSRRPARRNTPHRSRGRACDCVPRNRPSPRRPRRAARLVGIQQQRSDGAHGRALRVAEQRLDPAGAITSVSLLRKITKSASVSLTAELLSRAKLNGASSRTTRSRGSRRAQPANRSSAAGRCCRCRRG